MKRTLQELDATLTPSTQSELDYIVDNYRDGERDEWMKCGCPPVCVGDFEEIFTIRIGGDICGYIGYFAPPGDSILSPRRILCWMSCANVEKHKLAFVKGSRTVLGIIVRRTPEWVTYFQSDPPKSYVKSIRWQKRVLGFREIRDFEWNGHVFTLLQITRKEAI